MTLTGLLPATPVLTSPLRETREEVGRRNGSVTIQYLGYERSKQNIRDEIAL